MARSRSALSGPACRKAPRPADRWPGAQAPGHRRFSSPEPSSQLLCVPPYLLGAPSRPVRFWEANVSPASIEAVERLSSASVRRTAALQSYVLAVDFFFALPCCFLAVPRRFCATAVSLRRCPDDLPEGAPPPGLPDRLRLGVGLFRCRRLGRRHWGGPRVGLRGGCGRPCREHSQRHAFSLKR